MKLNMWVIYAWLIVLLTPFLSHVDNPIASFTFAVIGMFMIMNILIGVVESLLS